MTKALFGTISSLYLTLHLYGYTEISGIVLNILLLHTINEKLQLCFTPKTLVLPFGTLTWVVLEFKLDVDLTKETGVLNILEILKPSLFHILGFLGILYWVF